MSVCTTTTNLSTSAEAPIGASRDAERRSDSGFILPWQAIATL
ncbi:hypothetical protein [Halomonas chromatireducens]|nr:hypothetical protein [Halomonas chromatireducens]